MSVPNPARNSVLEEAPTTPDASPRGGTVEPANVAEGDSGIFRRTGLTRELRAAMRRAREEVLDQLLRGLRWVALLSFVAYAAVAYVYHAWTSLGLYGALFVVLWALGEARQLSLAWRGGLFIALLYATSIVSMATAGIGGATRAYLVISAMMVTILFGARAGVWAAAAAMATWFGAGAVITWLQWQPPAPPDSLEWVNWLSAGITLMMLIAAAVLPQRQFLETQAFAASTAQQKDQLEQARSELSKKAIDLELASRMLNEVNQRLTAQSRTLERRVTHLAVSAEVARVAATLHDLNTLLDTAVNLIGERFNFYHAALYLLDEDGEWAVLRASNSPGGRKLLARGHRLRVGQEGIIGFVTATGQPRFVLNAGEDAGLFPIPDLPESQSEMALPLRIRNGISGALDVHSTELNAFTDDDIAALQILADQLAVAIDNARLFEDAERNLEELRSLQRQARHEPNAPGAAVPLAYRYDGVNTAPLPPEDVQPESDALEVPIRLGEDTLGLLQLKRESGDWSASDRQLVGAIAERMGMALENARLFYDARSNAQRMTALSEATLVLTGPQFSRTDLLEAIARRARQLLRADSADLWLPVEDGEAIELAVTAPSIGLSVVGHRLKKDEGLAGRAFAIGQPLQLDDYQTTPGQMTALAVPMMWQNEILGVLVANRLQPDWRYTPEDETVARLFASAAASALSNTRLIDETRRRLEELETINRIGTVLASEVDLYTILRQVGDALLEIFGVQTGYIALYDSRTNLIEFPYFMENGLPAPTAPVPLGRGLTSHIIQTRQPLLMVHNAVEQGRALGAYTVGDPPLSFLGAPVIVGNDVIGILNVQSTTQDGLFDESDVRLMTIIAANLGVAIENARLFQQTQTALAETEALYQASADLNTAQNHHHILTALRRHTLLRDAHILMLNYFDEPWGPRNKPEWAETLAYWYAGGGELAANRTPVSSWMGLLLQADAPTIIDDLSGNPYIDDNTRAVYMIRYGVQSALFVPLVVGGDWVGYLCGLYSSVTVFPDGEVRRVMALSRQAAALIENFRNVTLIERRAQQLLTAAELSNAATSLLDEREIVQQTVELLRERFNLYYVALFLVEESGQWAELRHASGGAGDAARLLLKLGHRLEVGGQSMVGWAVANRKARISENVAEETVRYVNPLTPDTKSEMALPLVVGESALGAISIQSERRNAFSEADIAILQTLADQIATSIQNARLFRRVSTQEFNASALANIARSVTGKLDEQDVWRTLATELFNAYKADGVVISRWDEGGQSFTPRALMVDAATPEPPNWPAIGEALPAADHPDLLTVAYSRTASLRTLSPIGEYEIRESMIVPLLYDDAVDSVVEVIYTGPRPGLSTDDLNLLRAAVTTAASAVRIARLYALQRETAERLLEVDRLKSQFLANMSHELRTPLNSIIGFSRVILKGIDGPINDIQRQDLGSIYSSGQHLLGLINDILDLSRIEAGRMELVFAETHLPEIFDGVLATTRGLVRDKSIELLKDVPADLPAVRADHTRVRQVLLNLLSNAAKFTERGHITLRGRVIEDPAGPMVQVSVADSGHGIGPKDMPRLFERFSQVDDSPTRKVGGTGLGLHISRQLVELHGGRIWVESEPGRGAVFHFTLPLFTAQSAAPAPLHGQPTILVIEDDHRLFTLYRRYLETHGYALIGVESSAEAVGRAADEKPVAILLDVMMPERDGWQVLTELKQHPATRDIPVIMCTITDEPERARQLGAADYLVKPILESDLIRALHKLPNGAQVNGKHAN